MACDACRQRGNHTSGTAGALPAAAATGLWARLSAAQRMAQLWASYSTSGETHGCYGARRQPSAGAEGTPEASLRRRNAQQRATVRECGAPALFFQEALPT